jgi:hypothetical protein
MSKAVLVAFIVVAVPAGLLWIFHPALQYLQRDSSRIARYLISI